jgi:hypothetical protein
MGAIPLTWATLAPAASRPASQPADLEAAGRQFVELLAQGNTTQTVLRFDENMKAALPAPRLKEAWASLVAENGAYENILAARAEPIGNDTAVLVTCRFARRNLDVKVVYDAQAKVSGLWFQPTQEAIAPKPPPYADRMSFRERPVTVGSGRLALSGTLAVPLGEGPFPAVVLVHGSGPHDRDETLGANKPFRDLAWGLASKGVAVLRYEKRTRQHAAYYQKRADVTVDEEVVDDALAAVELLGKTQGVDPKRIFVLGHSLGGMMAPRVAQRRGELAGLILLAGPAGTMEDAILRQMNYILSLSGMTGEEQTKAMRQIEAQVAKVKDPALTATMPKEELPFGAPASYWLSLRGYDQLATAKKVDRPMLVLQGGRDYQVTAEDFDAWKAALAGRKDVTFKLYPKLDHLFIAGEGKSTPADLQRPGNVDRAVIEDIAQWVKGAAPTTRPTTPAAGSAAG